jgi:hypothetical protein
MRIVTHEIARDKDIYGRKLAKPRTSRSRAYKTFGKKYCRGAFFALAT